MRMGIDVKPAEDVNNVVPDTRRSKSRPGNAAASKVRRHLIGIGVKEMREALDREQVGEQDEDERKQHGGGHLPGRDGANARQ